jgi:hypothetical protein
MVKGITAEGLDFLEDDGGLSAILRTVTVRFDAENLRSLIEQKILSLSLLQEKKETAITELKKLPVEALKATLLKLAEKGIEHVDIVAALRSIWP